MEKILSFKDISFEREDFRLKDVNFDFYAGDIVGLIGENGAGKTTLFNLIFKNLTATKGQQTFLDKDYQDAEKAQMAIILDKNYLPETATVKEIDMIFSRVFSEWDSDLYFQYLTKYQLPLDKKIASFSQGMKVKLNFAYAFCRKAKLILLDEATNGMDPVSRHEVLMELQSYAENNACTILLSSHILSDLEKITTRVFYLKNGQLEEQKQINHLEELMMEGAN